MKLYTEEQVKKLLKYLTLSSPSVDGYMDTLIPIELPSDEEIVKKSKGEYYIEEQSGFIIGAVWVKEQIINQNK